MSNESDGCQNKVQREDHMAQQEVDKDGEHAHPQCLCVSIKPP